MNMSDAKKEVEVANADLAWLAGFWDADGSIFIRKQGDYLVPTASCTNTSETAILNVKRIFEAADIDYHLEFQDRSNLKNSRDAWIIRVSGGKRLPPLLRLMESYLVVKRQQALLVLEWCSLKKTDGPNGLPDEYHSIKDKIKVLNSRGRIT